MELKKMGAELGINSGGKLLAQLLVRLTYQEQKLQAQFHNNEGSKIRKEVEARVETQF